MLQTFRLSSNAEPDSLPAVSSSRAFNALIAEHLRASKLHFTLAVFQREAGSKHSSRSPEQLLSMLRVSPGTQLHGAITGEAWQLLGPCAVCVPFCAQSA